MYNKVTTKPTTGSFQDYSAISKLNNNNRAFSFADPIHSSNCTESINNFIQKFMMLQQATNISRTLPGLLMINCDDINNLNELLADGSTQKHVKDRINKYIKITQYISIGCPQIKNQHKYTRKSQQHSQQTINNNYVQNRQKMTTKNDIEKYKTMLSEDYEVRSFKQDTVSSKKNLITSRYVSNKQDQKHFNARQSDLSSRVRPIKQLNKAQSKSNHNRSVSSSRASNSKSFNKIELKSVNKIKPKQSGTFNKTTVQNKQIKNQKNKKYTISKRDEGKKNQKAISNQVSYIKDNSNNSLIVSRIKSSNPLNRSGITQHCKVSPKNRHRLAQQSIPTQQSRLRCQNDVSRDTNMEIGIGESKTQITKQTVQKSTQFMNMLRMMSEE